MLSQEDDKGCVYGDQSGREWYFPELMMSYGRCTVGVQNIIYKECTQEKRGKASGEKLARSQGNGWICYVIQRISKSDLPSSLKKLQPVNSLLKRKLSTSGQTVELRGTNHSMPESDHKEADTRILLHLQNGSVTCSVHTMDTDVIVILICHLDWEVPPLT